MFFCPTWSICCTNASGADLWNNEEFLCKIATVQKRGRHGTQRNSGHSLGEKSLPGLGKIRAWHPGEQPIHREHGKGSIWVLTEEASSKEQFGAAGLINSTFSKISRRERQVHNPRKAKSQLRPKNKKNPKIFGGN